MSLTLNALLTLADERLGSRKKVMKTQQVRRQRPVQRGPTVDRRSGPSGSSNSPW